MRLTEDPGIRATGTNVSGYALFIASSKLTVSAGSPIGGGRVVCAVEGAERGPKWPRAEGGLRGTYPRSSEDGIYNQEVPETVLMDFSSKSSELAVLEFPDRPARFTTERGRSRSNGPPYKVGERGGYRISSSSASPKQDLELPFFTIWRKTRTCPRRRSPARWRRAPAKRPTSTEPPASPSTRRRSTKKPKN